jgi:DNA-binding MarR family transcriptional regulator
MTITQLSEAFGLDASTLNRQTAALTREGLAERIPDADGGIARKFRITGQGARRLEIVRAETIGFLNLLMDDWTTREVADFAAYLKRFNADIERMDGRPWPRPEE